MRPSCPRCHKQQPHKNGQAIGKRRWKCRFCEYEYTQTSMKGQPEELKRKAASLYEHGMSSQQVALLLGVSPSSVLKWARWYTWPQGRVHHMKPKISLKRLLRFGPL